MTGFFVPIGTSLVIPFGLLFGIKYKWGISLDIKDLKSGDVLLFSPEKNSWLSDAIVWLTGAPVSHTAMTYKQFEDIIEETVPHVRVAPANERFKGRTIHVMRDKRNQNFEPVINASTRYLNELEPYGMPNLYLVGMILLYKKFTPSGDMQKARLKLLKFIVEKLLPIIDKHEYGTKDAMVCSQFVFQCYQDAGKDYELTIKNGNLLGAAKLDEAQSDSLLSKASQYTSNKKIDSHQLLKSNSDLERDGESVLKQLKSDIGEFSQEIEDETLDTVHHLAQIIHAVTEGIDLNQASSSIGLSILQKQQAMFVTPADLLEHCPDLEKIGIIEI